jgi:DDE superfamily endonuclease/Helix-turn-helix of DDE superfamily endonuclease
MTPLRYGDLADKPEKLLSLTSLTKEAFENLSAEFEKQYIYHMNTYTLEGDMRTQRAYTEYKNSPLPDIKDKLLFILIYIKQNLTQEMMSLIFSIHQPRVHLWIYTLMHVLKMTFRSIGDAPARDMESLKEKLATIEVGIDLFLQDGTERPIPRPGDDQEQYEHYSGKKKRHTIKNLVLVHNLVMLFLSYTYNGKVHDKKIADSCPYPLPLGSTLGQDLGFVGYLLEGILILMPHKKPKGGELTEEQKLENQYISSLRVPVEHVLGSVKRCRIVGDVIRLWSGEIRDTVMEVCCSLHNFRLRINKSV